MKNLKKDLTSELNFEEMRKVRFHVVRHTDYGDRYKMFAFQINPNANENILNLIGLELEKNENNNFDVVNLNYNSPAEKRGMDFYDEITRIEISSVNRPPKEYVYIIAFILLLLITYSQHKLSLKREEWIKKYLKKGSGPLVGFELKGGKNAGQQFIDNLKLIYHVANIGDARTLAIHPATTTHSQLSEEDQLKAGVTPGYVRLSIGLEHIDDILQDLKQALDNAN